jgi:hypothetical protein
MGWRLEEIAALIWGSIALRAALTTPAHYIDIAWLP